MKYKRAFKCLLCGETEIDDVVMEEETVQEIVNQCYTTITNVGGKLHLCDDGGIGVYVFQGFVPIDDKKEKK